MIPLDACLLHSSFGLVLLQHPLSGNPFWLRFGSTAGQLELRDGGVHVIILMASTVTCMCCKHNNMNCSQLKDEKKSLYLMYLYLLNIF